MGEKIGELLGEASTEERQRVVVQLTGWDRTSRETEPGEGEERETEGGGGERMGDFKELPHNHSFSLSFCCGLPIENLQGWSSG